MHTLALADRDLLVAPSGGIQTYTGARRLQQDITLNLGEEFGTDRFHPKFGSVLSNFVGQVTSPALQHSIEAEVARVLNNYLAAQRDYLAADITRMSGSNYTTADVLAEIMTVQTSVSQDTITVVITMRNVSRETIIVTATSSIS